jgi:hypothetical protein
MVLGMFDYSSDTGKIWRGWGRLIVAGIITFNITTHALSYLKKKRFEENKLNNRIPIPEYEKKIAKI